MIYLEGVSCGCCGRAVDISRAERGFVRCAYCNETLTLPKRENPAVLSFLRQGEHDLDVCMFESAFSAYKKAAEYDPEEPEAHFGMALSQFRVQYLRDISENPPRLQPICHEIQRDRRFTRNRHYLEALRLATPEQRVEYEKKAEEIEYIADEFFKLEQTGLDYDCFLCVKVSQGDEKTNTLSAREKVYTEDSKDATYIYQLLQKNGYAPFYSEYEIRNKQGADYEAHILYALYKSECMLVICSDESYLQTPWVKNEYTRFLKLIGDDEKESDAITIVFKGKPIERLPNKRGKLQGIDFSQREADGQVIEYVKNHTPESRRRREEEMRSRQLEDESQRRRMQELEEQFKAFRAQMERSDEVRAREDAARREAEEAERQREEFARRTREEEERLAREREELARKAKEEEERLAREREELARRTREEEERLARRRAESERREREEAERRARQRAENERREREEAERRRREENNRNAYPTYGSSQPNRPYSSSQPNRPHSSSQQNRPHSSSHRSSPQTSTGSKPRGRVGRKILFTFLALVAAFIGVVVGVLIKVFALGFFEMPAVASALIFIFGGGGELAYLIASIVKMWKSNGSWGRLVGWMVPNFVISMAWALFMA